MNRQQPIRAVYGIFRGVITCHISYAICHIKYGIWHMKYGRPYRSSSARRGPSGRSSMSRNRRDARRARQSGDYEDRAQKYVDDIIRRQTTQSAWRMMGLKQRDHRVRGGEAQRAEQQVNGAEYQRESAGGAGRSGEAEIKRQRGRY